MPSDIPLFPGLPEVAPPPAPKAKPLEGFYVLESFVPLNPRHRPTFKAIEAGEAARLLKRAKNYQGGYDSGKSRHWKLVHPESFATEEEAEALGRTLGGLHQLEAPALYDRRSKHPRFELPCGCRVSRDRRRRKMCPTYREMWLKWGELEERVLVQRASVSLALAARKWLDKHLAEGWYALEKLEAGRR